MSFLRNVFFFEQAKIKINECVYWGHIKQAAVLMSLQLREGLRNGPLPLTTMNNSLQAVRSHPPEKYNWDDRSILISPSRWMLDKASLLWMCSEADAVNKRCQTSIMRVLRRVHDRTHVFPRTSDFLFVFYCIANSIQIPTSSRFNMKHRDALEELHACYCKTNGSGHEVISSFMAFFPRTVNI